MRKKNKKDIKRPMVIVTSSDIISTYFSQMRKDCRYDNLTITLVKAKTLKELLTQTARVKNAGKFKMAYAVFSTSQFSDATTENILNAEKAYEPRHIGLAYAAHSIMLYWALHFKSLTGDEDANALNEVITRYVPSFKRSAEFLQGEGVNFHLMLFPKKAIAAANANALNSSYRLRNGIDAINFTKLLNTISDYCGEADIVKNQKTIA